MNCAVYTVNTEKYGHLLLYGGRYIIKQKSIKKNGEKHRIYVYTLSDQRLPKRNFAALYSDLRDSKTVKIILNVNQIVVLCL